MDWLWVLLIVLVVIALIALAFTLIRKRQRSGSVLAAPPSTPRRPK